MAKKKKKVAVRRIDVLSDSGQLVRNVEILSERERVNLLLAMPIKGQCKEFLVALDHAWCCNQLSEGHVWADFSNFS